MHVANGYLNKSLSTDSIDAWQRKQAKIESLLHLHVAKFFKERILLSQANYMNELTFYVQSHHQMQGVTLYLRPPSLRNLQKDFTENHPEKFKLHIFESPIYGARQKILDSCLTREGVMSRQAKVTKGITSLIVANGCWESLKASNQRYIDKHTSTLYFDQKVWTRRL